jgi:galactokinase
VSQLDHRSPSFIAANVLAGQSRELLQRNFNCSARWVVAAPGRVNLIGEHTDYNGGFVMPMAIDRYTVIAASSADFLPADSAEVFSTEVGACSRIRLNEPMERGNVSWVNYVQGVVAGCVRQGWSVPPFCAVIHSNVPLGGGLSSSAALEVATATLLEAISGKSLSLVDKALLCQKAEHTFAGVPCGIMDQFSSAMCEAHRLLLLDCRSQEFDLVPFTDPDIQVVIANSNVKHELTGGEYARRRSECEQAAGVLGVPFLRDASLAQLESARNRLDPVAFVRARHVISEIDRTVAAAQALRAGDWKTVGELMYASHASLRDDYEVSCSELDLLVEIAGAIGWDGGVIGSRMTGGGFGGCTVSLVRAEAVPRFISELTRQYRQGTSIEPTVFATKPSQGAMVLSDHCSGIA